LNENRFQILISDRLSLKFSWQICDLPNDVEYTAVQCTQYESFENTNSVFIPKRPVGTAAGEALITKPDGNYPALFLNGRKISEDYRVNNVYGGRDTAVYYSGYSGSEYTTEHIYAINTAISSTAYCISCFLAVEKEICKFSRAFFSKTFEYVAVSCDGPKPKTLVFTTYSHITVYEAVPNNELLLKLQMKEKLNEQHLNVRTVDGYQAHVKLIFPTLTTLRKYPLLIEVNGEPDSNKISSKYSSGIEKYFASSEKYFYAFIDGRGCGRRGISNTYQSYKRLGQVEPEDIIAVVKDLLVKFDNYIDKSKIGLWGWHYGGYVTAHTLAHDTENLFKFGVAIAPISNFNDYGAIFTERYLNSPNDRNGGIIYSRADVRLKAEKLKDKTLLVMGGYPAFDFYFRQSNELVDAVRATGGGCKLSHRMFSNTDRTLSNHLGEVYVTLAGYVIQKMNEVEITTTTEDPSTTSTSTETITSTEASTTTETISSTKTTEPTTTTKPTETTVTTVKPEVTTVSDPTDGSFSVKSNIFLSIIIVIVLIL